MDLEDVSEELRGRFDARMHARERALPASRRAIRSCANAIRAIHRGEFELAHRLMDEARAAIDEGLAAVAEHPDIRFAGYLQDAQKEYAEARLTEAIVDGSQVPTPDAIGVEDAPYLNGMAEAIGEARRRVLDLLRGGRVDDGDAVLAAMEDLYAVLVTMDYPDAITGNLRRSTDVARSLIEKTRGDLAVARVSQDLHDALDRHAREVLEKEERGGR
ncbi:MAG TPA: haloacid dehalogenase [Actinomycetota bacterium]|nr:haloacid dehalogenase [Actinomycetota bacterium]